ncbi:MAG TPA: hypothetical protein VH054_13935, partial [Polyangiaceae bacterium]|nr:hypothetical protein [Polyangiaceae bacterium]
LFAEGSDRAAILRLQKAIEAAGASVKLIAPKVGPTKVAGGAAIVAEQQLAGAPSVLFDAVAIIASEAGAASLATHPVVMGFVHDAFNHLKAIGVDAGGRKLLRALHLDVDAGVVDIAKPKAFIEAAKTRQWARERS